MLENTNIKQFYPGPILNKTLDITDFLFKDPEQVHITYSYKKEDGSLSNRELTYGTDYEVTKILPSDVTQADAALTASTGRVTLKTDINVALGERLTIYRESELIQETQYPRTGPFPAASHEGALDYLTMQNQEQQDQIDRSLKVPISTANFDGALPVPVPARALKINNSGSGFEFSEYDPDTALETTKEYMESAQTAASNALTSQIAANSSETAATQQANLATQQATIATNKAEEASEIVDNAVSNIVAKGTEQITLIQNEGATQVANVQSTGFYMRDDKLYFINSQGEETEFKSGGSGLELCDIGMALYIDETKGLRRYLNGQIVDINTNTQAFLNRLQQITTLHTSLLCTEEEWQTAKTMSAFGQVGKFVFNYSNDKIVSVRLPRVVNVQGLFDLQNLGMTVSAGLPDHNHSTYFAYSNVSFTGGQGGATDFIRPHNVATNVASTNASASNPIYGNSDTVQPEAIQYPYFIQIATGSETENNIINEIELNNPYSLFDSKYSNHELNNLSWLKSEGQWNAKAVYPSVYDLLLKIYNGTETKDGVSVKLWTDESATDYDFRINTADETFRLPLLDGSEDLISDKYIDLTLGASGDTYTAPANGWLILARQANGTNQYVQFNATEASLQSKNMFLVGDEVYNNGVLAYCHMPIKKGQSTKIYYNAGGTVFAFRFVYAQGNGSLYYYVGETVQNANLIDAGRIGEQLANKQDKLSRYPIAVSDKSLMPSWYVVYNDGWCVQGGRTGSVGNDVLVNFIKTYSDVPVVIGLPTIIGGVVDGALNIYNLSTTGFKTHWVYNATPKPISWQASGYIN